ncbi:ABC transporter ATP-binding protein [Flavonifractor sp. An100]|uniref:ABC transporter ATP-binding protein n=1 Tax=Flavonifractor sp. An100 TaxID=1965538 RepID=UPI000B39EA39|nr:ABC transporter ATP-binding protein [Flavonifractor sp. An100]OUQ79466.1 ABC transporter ATP-binding protein [Flavonifractor sp. An100]
MSRLPKEPVKLVPVPSTNKIPERDIGQSPILECRHLGIDFGGLAAVKDFNMAIGRTEIAGLIGPNGAGKTTVFNLLTKVYQPTRGSILIDGQETSRMNTVQVNRAGIARTFQNIRLFDKLSVEDNVKIGLHNQIRYPMWDGILRLPSYWKKEKLAHESAMELLSIFGMEDLAGHQAGSLPYGAQRRLEIVRALATNPSLLLLDEPAAGMNPSETADLMENIVKIRDTFHIAILLIEHDMNLVMGICEGICVLNFGQIIAKGTPDEIKNNPVVIEAYLGKGNKGNKGNKKGGK